MLDNPFLPLLFFSESVKVFVMEGFVANGIKMAILFVISLIVWLLSDAISVDIDKDKIIG